MVLANRILDGVELENRCMFPDIHEVEELYKNTFEVIPKTELTNNQARISIKGIYAPVSVDEVKEHLLLKVSDAPGPDGMKIRNMKKISPFRWALLFNGMLMTATTPPSLCKCRTNLVRNAGKNLKEVDGWRPIAIGPLVIRTFHRTLAKRLAIVEMHPAQRGFRSMDGTLANVLLLQSIIKSQREKGRPYTITSIDLKRAFDTIPHSVIEKALCCSGVDQRFTKYVINSLSNGVTIISVGGTSTNPIKHLRSVKQDDPMSPFLFNIALDELVRVIIYDRPVGLYLGNARIPILGYADDLLLLSASNSKQQIVLDECYTFFKMCCMGLTQISVIIYQFKLFQLKRNSS